MKKLALVFVIVALLSCPVWAKDSGLLNAAGGVLSVSTTNASAAGANGGASLYGTAGSFQVLPDFSIEGKTIYIVVRVESYGLKGYNNMPSAEILAKAVEESVTAFGADRNVYAIADTGASMSEIYKSIKEMAEGKFDLCRLPLTVKTVSGQEENHSESGNSSSYNSARGGYSTRNNNSDRSEYVGSYYAVSGTLYKYMGAGIERGVGTLNDRISFFDTDQTGWDSSHSDSFSSVSRTKTWLGGAPHSSSNSSYSRDGGSKDPYMQAGMRLDGNTSNAANKIAQGVLKGILLWQQRESPSSVYIPQPPAPSAAPVVPSSQPASSAGEPTSSLPTQVGETIYIPAE